MQGLAAWDGALITIGAMLGSGIFLTTDDIARRLPQGGLILLLWGAGRLVTLAGALAYTEPGEGFRAPVGNTASSPAARHSLACCFTQAAGGVRASADAPERSYF